MNIKIVWRFSLCTSLFPGRGSLAQQVQVGAILKLALPSLGGREDPVCLAVGALSCGSAFAPPTHGSRAGNPFLRSPSDYLQQPEIEYLLHPQLNTFLSIDYRLKTNESFKCFVKLNLKQKLLCWLVFFWSTCHLIKTNNLNNLKQTRTFLL